MGLEQQFSSGEVSQPFWQALEQGRLRLPSCGRCGAVFFFPRRWCPLCWADDVHWVDASGRGVVYARTEVQLPFQGIDEADLPLVALLVDLEEGPRIAGRAHPAARGMQIGDHVQLAYAPDPAEGLPSFVMVD